MEKDLEVLYQIQSLWEGMNDDPKYDKFESELKSGGKLFNKKILVFSESTETGGYLYNKLFEEFGDVENASSVSF